jgi:hypothetical protein
VFRPINSGSAPPGAALRGAFRLASITSAVVIGYALANAFWRKPESVVPDACVNKLELSARLRRPEPYVVAYDTQAGQICAWESASRVGVLAADPSVAQADGRARIAAWMAVDSLTRARAGSAQLEPTGVEWSCTTTAAVCPVPDRSDVRNPPRLLASTGRTGGGL